MARWWCACSGGSLAQHLTSTARCVCRWHGMAAYEQASTLPCSQQAADGVPLQGCKHGSCLQCSCTAWMTRHGSSLEDANVVSALQVLMHALGSQPAGVETSLAAACRVVKAQQGGSKPWLPAARGLQRFLMLCGEPMLVIFESCCVVQAAGSAHWARAEHDSTLTLISARAATCSCISSRTSIASMSMRCCRPRSHSHDAGPVRTG